MGDPMKPDPDHVNMKTFKKFVADVGDTLDDHGQGIDETRQVMMMCVDADRKFGRLLQQMNDRLTTIEKTINTFIYGEGFEARAPSTYRVSDEIARAAEESDELTDEDVERLLRKNQTRAQASEVKHQMNVDGTQIFRFKLPGQRWAVVKVRPDGSGLSEPPFIEDINGSRDELDYETAQALLAQATIYIPNRPMGSDPDPDAMQRVMNPEDAA